MNRTDITKALSGTYKTTPDQIELIRKIMNILEPDKVINVYSNTILITTGIESVSKNVIQFVLIDLPTIAKLDFVFVDPRAVVDSITDILTRVLNELKGEKSKTILWERKEIDQD